MLLVQIFTAFFFLFALAQCQRRTTTEKPWIWGDNEQSSTQSTVAGGRTTPFRRDQPSPRICPGCPRTPQFNPVCGSDMATYENPNALECANSCGPRIEILFYAACQPTA